MVSKSEYKRIKAMQPPRWDEYDKYLQEGGNLEYGEWLRTVYPASSASESALGEIWLNKEEDEAWKDL